MFDDPGDLDHNGIPDSIQRDPVVVPGEEDPFDVFAPDRALPGFVPAVDPTLVAPAPPVAPVAPTPPPADADEAALARFQEELKQYGTMLDVYSNLMNAREEMLKSIAQNLRA